MNLFLEIFISQQILCCFLLLLGPLRAPHKIIASYETVSSLQPDACIFFTYPDYPPFV